MGGGRKEILLAVSGSTPQVITEALYCLRVERNVPISRVVVITTKVGRGKILEKLLDRRYGHFWQFLKDYGISEKELVFSEDNVFVPEKKSGEPIEDIFGPGENELLCSLIVEKVREFTEDDATVVHASIAGGRKTMSSYLALAMGLFGREQDRLYHVLVSPPEFEFHDEFFYPPPKPLEIKRKTEWKKEVINTDLARVTLIDVPFVRLRKFVGRKKGTLDKIVSEIQTLLDRSAPLPEVSVDFDESCLVVEGKRIKVRPTLLSYFLALLSYKLQCDKEICEDCRECFVEGAEISVGTEFTDRWLKIYEVLAGGGHFEKTLKSIREERKAGSEKSEEQRKRFYEYQSKLNRIIDKAKNEFLIPPEIAVLLKVEKIGGYGESRYGVALKPESFKDSEVILDAVERDLPDL